jgi:hypothetical protein
MQNIASPPPDRFDERLRRLPVGLDLHALAHPTKAAQRKREIDAGAHLLRLALARGPGGLSLSQTAAWGHDARPGGNERSSGETPARQGRRVPGRRDGQPTRGESARCRRPLDRAHPAPQRRHIRIGDRGFARAPSPHRFRQQSADKADFIVRVGWAAFSLTGQDGEGFDLIGHLPAGTTPHAVAVRAKLGPALPMRLSKQLKSLLGMHQIPTRTERASRSWLTAHLIMALLCDDISQEFLESSP